MQKGCRLLLLFILSTYYSSYAKNNNLLQGVTIQKPSATVSLQPEQDKKHYLIEFVATPKDEKQHGDWVYALEKALKHTNETLIENGLLAPHRYSGKQEKEKTTLEQVKKVTQEWFYNAFFHSHTLTYPKKLNYAFFTRHNEHFGSLGVYAPDGVPPDVFLKTLAQEISKQGVAAHILPDHTIHLIGTMPEAFDHITFTKDALTAFKNGKLQAMYRDKIKQIEQARKEQLRTNQEKTLVTNYTHAHDVLEDLQEQLFWFQEIPTTGIRLKENVAQFGKKRISPWSLDYPYLPHRFPLWQMAPKLGEGITVAVIDSGIAAFTFSKQEDQTALPIIKKNQDLFMEGDFLHTNYNLIHDGSLDPLDQFAGFVGAYLDRNKFDNNIISYKELEKECTQWIYDYLQPKQSLSSAREYLIKYGNNSLINEKDTSQLSDEGTVVLKQIEQKMSYFHSVKLLQEDNSESTAILEFIPTAPLVAKREETLQSCHGSHVSGIIAGRLQQDSIEQTHFQPLNNEGICGIAPKAKIVMIKAFSEKGCGHTSTLIAGLTKSLAHGAHVVNMSLKVSDYINQAAGPSKMLETLINLIPYTVAASGNNGDPHKQNYPGSQIESYPARFGGITFDVGAFSFDDKNKTCPIPLFSQYQLDPQDQKSIGPKVVAPGYNILSCGLAQEQEDESVYVIMKGTSMATPMISGFIALMLSEFSDENDFSRDQMLRVCYRSGIKMHDDDEWDKRSIFGSLDMRTVLFTLHVLRNFKKQKPENVDLLNQKFNTLLEVTHTLLFGMVDEYSQKELDATSFKNNFIGFYKEVEQRAEKNIKAPVFQPFFNNFSQAISFCVQALNYAVTPAATQPKGLSQTLAKKLREVYTQGKEELFDHIHQAAQNRINQALHSSKEISKEVKKYLGKTEAEKMTEKTTSFKDYWDKQAALLKQGKS